MLNHGSGGDFERSDLRLYVSSDSVTTVRLTYTPNPDTLVVELAQPNRPYEIDVAEIFGASSELTDGAVNGGQTVSRKSFHITADHEVTLYGVNIRVMSSDAFLALPDDVLTGRYIVTAWPNGFLQTGDYDKSSEFAVIGTEDGTTVRITPSTVLLGRTTTETFTVGLNRGDVYFGQAQLGLPNDVSGTEIRANKPVAVYAGNQRTSVPTDVGNFRDHLVEQMPPIEAWGNTAILTPHYSITPRSRHDAEARILAAFDDTEVTVTTASGPTRYVLNAKQPLQISPLTAANVTSTKPILVAQYEHSVEEYSDPLNGGQAELGDPFMMLIPAPEQYDTAYAFQSVNHTEFLAHYINVIVPAGAEGSLMLDGNPVVGAAFRNVPGTNHLYAQIKVGAGSHYIRADEQFGLCVYGFGRANSYGYTGGTLFRTLVNDFQRPDISDLLECDVVSGIVADGRLTDSGIDSCFATPKQRNVNLEVEPFEAGADTVLWKATLLDPYQDGFVELKAIDAAGRSTIHSREVPGFTVEAIGTDGNSMPQQEIVSYNGKQTCTEFTITNYGRFPHHVNSTNLVPSTLPGLSIEGDDPIVLEPGESRTITVCYEGLLEEPVDIGLSLSGDCIDRDVATMRIVSVIDTVAPSLINHTAPCGNVTVTFEEPNQPYLRVESIVVDTLINGQYSSTPSEAGLPARVASVTLVPVDFREDMIYEVTVRDMAGNSRTIRDTLGGFTVAVREEPLGERLAIRLAQDWISDTLGLTEERCDSLQLTNYGSRPLTVSRMFMDQNAWFSIPPTQLPITLEPGETRRFAVCLEGRVAGEQIDTLLVMDGCGRWENVLLRTPVDIAVGTGIDFCGNSVTVQSRGAAKRTFLAVPAPNPASGTSAFVDVGLTRDEVVTIEMLDATGERSLPVLTAVPLDAGIHRIDVNIGPLESGLYFCRMTTGSGDVLSQSMIIRE